MKVFGKERVVKNIKAWIIGGVSITVCIIIGIIYITSVDGKDSADKTVSKESTVTRGNLIAGVTETGSITVGTLEQTYDLDLSTSTSSTTSSTNSTTSSNQDNSSNNMVGSSNSGANSTSSSTSNTTTSTSSLIIESVNASIGQFVSEGDLLYTLTEESMDTTREKLILNRDNAKIALTEATIKRDSDLLDAKHTYETSINDWNMAQTEYDTKINELADAVSTSQSSLTAANQKVTSLEDQITQIQSEYNAAITEYNNSLALVNSVDKENDIVTYLNNQTAVSTAKSNADKIYAQWETLIDSLNSTKSSVTELTASLNNAISTQSMDSTTAQQDYQTKQLTAQKAKEVYNLAVSAANDTVTEAQEDLDEAQEKLDEFETFVGDGGIRSAYTGTIMDLGYEKGSSLSSSTAIATFVDASNVEVTVDVSEEDISVVTVGDTVNIEFLAYPDVLYSGTVTGIAGSVTNQKTSTVNYPVTVVVSGDVSQLYDGMTGDVTFITKEVVDVLCVSNKAITVEGTKSYVKKKDESGNIILTEVTTGFSEGSQVEIQSGLEEGDVVIIESKVNNK